MVLYHFDFTVVAFPFGSFLLFLLFAFRTFFFWIDVVDLMDKVARKRKAESITYRYLLTLCTHQERGDR